MASGGHLDKLAAEYGIHFVAPARRIDGTQPVQGPPYLPSASQEKHGPGHLRLVFGLINTPVNRGNWSSQVLSAVSWLVLNKPDLVEHPDFVSQIRPAESQRVVAASEGHQFASAPTITLAVLLAHELDAAVSAILPGKVA